MFFILPVTIFIPFFVNIQKPVFDFHQFFQIHCKLNEYIQTFDDVFGNQNKHIVRYRQKRLTKK